MEWFDNPITWLVIFGALVVISVILFGIISAFRKSDISPSKNTDAGTVFKPTIVGKVAQVPIQSIVKFITDMNPDQVRALVIINTDTFENKKAQMKRAMELYSLLDQRIFSEMYEKVFKSAKNKLAENDDIGGILLAHYDNNRKIELYTMFASEIGEPIAINNQQFNSKRQAANAAHYFYTHLQSLADYLVVIISGPNLTDLDQDIVGETILDPEESFGMYDSALSGWLNKHEKPEPFGMYSSALGWLTHHPSSSSVAHYNRRKKQQIHNVSSLTTNQHMNSATHRYYNPSMKTTFDGYIRAGTQ